MGGKIYKKLPAALGPVLENEFNIPRIPFC